MAMRAFLRLGELVPDSDPGFRCGVACTAALATDRVKKGEHAIYLALQTLDMTKCFSVGLEKGRRTREQEEQLASELLLSSLADVTGNGVPDIQGINLTEEQISMNAVGKPDWGQLLIGNTQVVSDRLGVKPDSGP